MRVLLIGSGGREHALAQALKRDTKLIELHVAPGNPGIAEIAECHALDLKDNQEVINLAKKLNLQFNTNEFKVVKLSVNQ